ncbi:MAG: tandem-95 repeat protein, partial [Planctomycetaceae bacterium]
KDTAGSVSNVATVTVTIQPPVVPVAANDTATVAAGGSVTINLVLNDTTSATGTPLDLASVAIAALPLPAKGTVTNNGNGTITYSQTVAPAAGSDTVAYTVKDTAGSVSNVATVTVTISNPPVANADTVTTDEDTPAILNVIANDADPDAPLNTIAPATVLVTLQPAHGTAVALGNGTVRYTPNLNYNNTALTPDTFTYTVSDTLGNVSFPATVSITVTPVADLPLAQNDSATTLMNTAVAINTLTNDSQADGLAIVPATLTIVNNPLHGTATVIVDPQNIDNRLIRYVPATNFFGTDSFTYLVRDNSAVPTASAPATVSVTVIQVNIPPVAVNDVANTTIGIARTINLVANDTDADGAIDPASVVIVTQPANGTLSVPTATGTVTYTPTAAGTDTFTYNVKDLAGAVSNNAQVTVSVASPITDSVNVLRAQFENATRQWSIEGNTVNLSTPLRTLIIRVGNDNAGQVIGTVNVAADGRWKFQLPGNAGNIGPDATRTISVSLPSGASRLAYPVAVK